MIGTIGFLVQDTTNRRRWLGATSLYTLACSASASALGGLLGVAGEGIHRADALSSPTLGAKGGIAFVGVLAIAYALSDVGLFAMPRPAVLFAVPVTWWRRWRPYRAAFAYGAALGVGVMTYVPFGAFYVLCVWCLLKSDPAYGTVLLGTYGLLRALTIIPASWLIYRQPRPQEDVNSCLVPLLSKQWQARYTIAVALAVFGAQMLVSASL